MPFTDEIPSTYRLPNDSIPLGYKLHLRTDIDQEIFEFDGNVAIHIKIVERTSIITLHYRQINITKVELWSAESQTYLRDLEYSYIDTHEFLKVNLTSESQVDDELILNIEYNGVLRADGGGFYRAYYDVNETRVWYGTTQFEVTDARHAMPCYDEPGIRAPIQLTFDHSPNYEAVSNTPVERFETVGNYRRTIFEPTPPMQTYLLAFLVSPFEYVTNNDPRVEQRIYAKPSSIRNGEADFSINVVKPILEKLEEHLKVNFPIRKMDHAAITQVKNNFNLKYFLISYLTVQFRRDGKFWQVQKSLN
jgi:aminopeptidase N